MSENKKTTNQNLALDDGRRVKVLSPGMMVFKRFIRNRLAIAGICILAFMFAFSFLGGIVSPYKQDQVFYKNDFANKEYAGAVVNTEYRYVTKDGKELPTATRANFILAAKNGDSSFRAGGTTYSVVKVDDGFYCIGTSKEVATIKMLGKVVDVMGDDYPELREHADFISRVVFEEEYRNKSHNAYYHTDVVFSHTEIRECRLVHHKHRGGEYQTCDEWFEVS